MKIPLNKIEYQYGPTYIRSKPDSIARPDIVYLVDHYKRYISHKLIPLHPDVLSRLAQGESRWNFGDEILSSVKIDGEGVIWVYDANAGEDGAYLSYFANDTTHRVWAGLPVNYELEKICLKQNITKLIVAGELFAAPMVHGKPDFNGRARVPDLLHVTRNPAKIDELNRVGFKVFDIIQLNGLYWLNRPYFERFQQVQQIFPDFGRASHIYMKLLSKTQIASFYDENVRKGGAEGIVIRNSTSDQGYKVKPIHDIDVVIIGVICDTSGEISSVLTALRYPDGSFQIFARVGTGLNMTEQKLIQKRIHYSTSEFVSVGPNGRAYKMIIPEIVVKLEYLDIVTEHGPNNPVFQPVVQFDPIKNNWTLIRELTFPKLISPRFSQENAIREDKDGSTDNVRVDQVLNFIKSDIPQSISSSKLPIAEILARKVYSKGEMVKKILLIQTHKSEIDALYAEFVIYFVDFSPNRQIPLMRHVRITNDEIQAHQIFQSLILEELMVVEQNSLKKGWNLISNFTKTPIIITKPRENGTKSKKSLKKSTINTNSIQISSRSTKNSKQQKKFRKIEPLN